MDRTPIQLSIELHKAFMTHKHRIRVNGANETMQDLLHVRKVYNSIKSYLKRNHPEVLRELESQGIISDTRKQ